MAGTYEFGFTGYLGNIDIKTTVLLYKDGRRLNGPQRVGSSTMSYTWMLKLSTGEEVSLKIETGWLKSLRFSGQLLKADD